MMDKETVLPLVGELTGTFDDGCVYSRLQRDADWERVKPLIDFLVVLANKDSYGGKGIPVKIANVAQTLLFHLDVEEQP